MCYYFLLQNAPAKCVLRETRCGLIEVNVQRLNPPPIVKFCVR